MGRGIATLVLLGPARRSWPEPLEELLRDEELSIAPVASVYEAAARVVADEDVRGLLLDPVILTKRDIEALALVTRRLPLTMLLLPHSELLAVRARDAMRYGALAWADAAVALKGLIARRADPAAASAMPDNHLAGQTLISAEKTMTPTPAVRYDDLGATPIVSDEEMQALLGT